MLALDMLRGAADAGAQPTLDLNFTSGTLDSRVTYTGASLATLTDATGAIAYKPHNLFVRSEELDSASWTKFNSPTVTGNTAVAPDGATTADSVTSAGTGGMYQFATLASGVTYTISCYAKQTTSGGSFGFYGQGGSFGSTLITPGSTWARHSFTFTASAAGSADNGLNRLVGVDIWGAQLNLGPLQPYYPTTSAAYFGPRFTYDPITLSALGLLIEEQRTQLLLNSLIDGTNLSTQSVTTTATAYTLSFYGTGTVTLSGTSTGAKVGTGAYPTRSTFTFTPTAGTLTLTVTGTVQYAQLEAGSFATSFIPTAGASVTRAADSATMTGSNFSSWFNASAGTFVTEATPGKNSNLPIYWGTDVNNAGKTCETNGRATNWSGSAALSTAAAVSDGVARKIALSYSGASRSLCQNAGTVATAASAAFGTPVQMKFGSDYFSASQFLNGTIARLRYYNTALTNAQLQALTT